MPLFVILSGYFFRDKGNLIHASLSNYKALAKPYLITAGVCLLVSCVFFDTDYTIRLLKGFFMGNSGRRGILYSTAEYQSGPMWFLASLFWCKCIFDILFKYLPRYCGWMCFMLFFVGFIVCSRWISIPLGLGAGLTMLPFYFIGYYLHNHTINIKIDLLILVIWMAAVKYSYLNMAQFIYSILPLAFMGGVSGSIVVWKSCKQIQGCVAVILSYIGRNTLTILCCHSLVYNLRTPILRIYSIEPECLIDDIVYIGGSVALSIIVLIFTHLIKIQKSHKWNTIIS